MENKIKLKDLSRGLKIPIYVIWFEIGLLLLAVFLELIKYIINFR